MSTTALSSTSPPTLLTQDPYEGYTYAYPHKTAYRPFGRPMPLSGVWGSERRDALFLYLHVPFCEMRCGFCNLFTTSNPADTLVQRYLAAVERQAEAFLVAVPDARFARAALGGGTPTFLLMEQLEAALGLFRRMGLDIGRVPFSVETSPATATPEKLDLMRAHGVDRISIGVQSFVDGEAAQLGRRQHRAEVEEALACIRAAHFPVLNLDLIYGGLGQTAASWRESLEAAVAWNPEEVFLYPLYIRPLTGLGRTGRQAADDRLELYRAGRDFLLGRGYTQISMRMFRASHAPAADTSAKPPEGGTTSADVPGVAPAYCAQDDGMVGLGSGARSYTRSVQYSTPYAVGTAGVLSIIREFSTRTVTDFAEADYGFELDLDEQHRRYVAITLLNQGGVPFKEYRGRFGSDVLEDLPQLRELEPAGLAVQEAGRLRLTEAGVERSDVIGPWLYSVRVTELMNSWRLQ